MFIYFVSEDGLHCKGSYTLCDYYHYEHQLLNNSATVSMKEKRKQQKYGVSLHIHQYIGPEKKIGEFSK